MEKATIRESVTDAIRYWELLRIVYNVVLGVIVVVYVRGLPSSKGMLGSFNFLLVLFVLAVLANVAYCAAYLVDVFAQGSSFRENWQSNRWILFLIGTIFAAILTRFISMAFFLPELQ
jgi:hypothetical protein